MAIFFKKTKNLPKSSKKFLIIFHNFLLCNEMCLFFLEIFLKSSLDHVTWDLFIIIKKENGEFSPQKKSLIGGRFSFFFFKKVDLC